MSLEPIPTQVTPALNHDSRLLLSVETPPVGIIFVQGQGPFMAFTKSAP